MATTKSLGKSRQKIVRARIAAELERAGWPSAADDVREGTKIDLVRERIETIAYSDGSDSSTDAAIHATTIRDEQYVWNDIAPKLALYGVDTDKVPNLTRRLIERQTKAEEVIADEEWESFAESLIEGHPLIEGTTHRRQRRAGSLLGYYTNVVGHDLSDEQLAENRFLVMEYSDGNGHYFHPVNDDYGIGRAHYEIANEEYPGYVEQVWDLDSDEEEDEMGHPAIYYPDVEEVTIIIVNNTVFDSRKYYQKREEEIKRRKQEREDKHR